MTDRRRHPPDTTGKKRHATPWTLTDEDRTAIRAAVAEMAPLTDEEVDALCEIITAARKRRDRRGIRTKHDADEAAPGSTD
jgi:hypothetical protein